MSPQGEILSEGACEGEGSLYHQKLFKQLSIARRIARVGIPRSTHCAKNTHGTGSARDFGEKALARSGTWNSGNLFPFRFWNGNSC